MLRTKSYFISICRHEHFRLLGYSMKCPVLPALKKKYAWTTHHCTSTAVQVQAIVDWRGFTIFFCKDRRWTNDVKSRAKLKKVKEMKDKNI